MFNKKVLRLSILFFVIGFLFIVVSACGKTEVITYQTLETEIEKQQVETIKNKLINYIDLTGVTDANALNLVRQKVTQIYNNRDGELEPFIDSAFTQLDELATTISGATTQDKETYKQTIISAQLNAAIEEGKIQIARYIKLDGLEDYQKELIGKALTKYTDKLSTATSAKTDGTNKRQTGTSCTGTPMESVSETQFAEATDVYKIVFLYTIQADAYKVQPAPIQFYGFKNGFWGHLFNNFFTFPVAWVMWTISRIFGGYYLVGLLLTTLIVRTLGWPIYAKTNDMSLKMQMMQPDLAKLEKKYENRRDPESQRMKQMEMAQIYRKYKLGIGGCLMPFLQFPIFMSIFRAITRIPYTNGTVSNTPNWTKDLNTSFLGIDLFKDRTQGDAWQLWGIIILAVLVVITQVISQLIAAKRQKQLQERSQENVPAYRRQAAAQTNQTQKTMKYMMYFMTFMMAMFVLSSAAGLGIYWLIGNLYSMLQAYLNNKMSDQRLEQLKRKHGI